jgi:hypothetical protein
MEQLDGYSRRAYEMVLSGKVQQAFDLSAEKDAVRDEYGRNSVGEKAILARRLVESGVTFILVSGKWGYFDHHGDQVQWGGIVKGLKPALPDVDRALYALVNDLAQRGLLDDTLVMMMGEFGRTPVINKDAGRDHWTAVMSMVMAGGGLRHGQVIGSTDSRGGAIASQSVRPQDLAATTFKHLGSTVRPLGQSARAADADRGGRGPADRRAGVKRPGRLAGTAGIDVAAFLHPEKIRGGTGVQVFERPAAADRRTDFVGRQPLVSPLGQAAEKGFVVDKARAERDGAHAVRRQALVIHQLRAITVARDADVVGIAW